VIKKVLASIVLIVMASVYLLTPLLTGDLDDTHLSAYSQDFDDLSDFKKDLDIYTKYFEENEDVDHEGYEIYTIMGSPTLLNGPDIDPERTLYIAVGIENRYSDADIEAIIAFVKAGGKVIIADDYGFGYEVAGNYGVTYYRNKFYDQEYDRNENFTIVTAQLGVDHFTPRVVSAGNLTGQNLIINNNDRNDPDGYWDDDQDCDGRVDEDPFEKGVPIDDDADKGRSAEDGIDNDHDQLEDQEDPNEGLNEDPRDDDGDWVDLNNNGVEDPMVWYDANGDDKFTWADLNGNGRYDRGESYVTEGANDIDEFVSGDYGVDEEILDGIDNDGDWIDSNKNGEMDTSDFGVDEDLQSYRILLNDATGMTSTGTRVIAHGSQNSFIDMDSIKGINQPEGPGKLADERSSPGNEIQIIVEVVVCPDCGGAIDIRSGECLNTLEARTGEECKENHNSEEYLDFGKMIFMSDSNLLTNDLYSLDHLVTDDRTGEIYQETDPIPVSEWEGAPEDRVSSDDDDDDNNLVDKTADGELDYDNKVFLRRLIEYLLPDGGLIIFDESRHAQDDPFLIPVYSTLYALAYITSDPFYGTALVLVFTFILFFLVLIIRDKESWVHNHNIGVFKGRKAVPSNTSAQVARLRHAIIERVRMNRGLSSEEFQQLGPKAAETMVNDPYLLDVLKNEGRAYSDTEMKNIMDRVRKLAG
jgi:hypothetical protein